jgi:YD repeat-containing protein
VLPDVAMPQTKYLYDDDHRLTRIVRPDGQTIDLVYDPQKGRLMRIENAERTVIATYDLASGLPSQLSNQRGASLSYTYDGSRRLSETSHEPDLDGAGQQVSWTYDANARVASERIDEAEEVTYTYNNDDELIGLGAMSLVRDPANAYVVAAALGVLSTSYTYDEFGALVGLQTAQSGAKLQNLSLTRDKLGRVKSRRDVVGTNQHPPQTKREPISQRRAANA